MAVDTITAPCQLQTANEANDTIVRAVVRGTFGYLTAGIACTWAGYALSQDRLIPAWLELAQFAIFWFLLGAALLNHEAFYELRRTPHSKHERVLSRQVPILLSLLAILGVCLYGDLLNHKLPYHSFWYMPFIIAAVPHGILAIYRIIRRNDPKVFTFRSRSYFPAFATCLPPFILGFYFYREHATSYLIVADGLILALWLLSQKTSLFVSSLVQALLLPVAIVFFVFGPEPIRVCIFGVFLTLAMGVSEAWRVTTRVIAGVEYRPQPYDEADKQFSLSGTNIATAFFLPLFLATYLHPQTKPKYLAFLVPTITFWYLLWFVRGGKKASLGIWTYVAFVCGISLPVILIVSVSFKGDVPLPHHLNLQQVGAPYTIMFGLASVILASSARTHIRMYIHETSPLAHYSDPFHAIALTSAISALLALFGFAAVGLWDMFGDGGSTHDRINYLILIYVVMAFVTFTTGWVENEVQQARLTKETGGC